MTGAGWMGIAALAAALAAPGTAPAQETPPAAEAPGAAAPETAEQADPQLTEAELDELVAPVALYPDSLLTQVLVASTYPLEVVKAARWVAGASGLAPDARPEAAAAEGWDPSVAVLAAGFPTVIERMADDLDWTEALGEALLAQSDDVLDAVQRQRARAAATGFLTDNAAQTVVETDSGIAIQPTDPQVVYVPSYDPALAYSSAPAGPAVVAAPVAGQSVATTEGWSTGSVVATGVLAFGAGLLVSEIFEDDDDDWNGYWGGNNVDWDDGNFYPRPGRGDINIDGDVNIDRSRDRVRGDGSAAWAPDPERRDEARKDIETRGADRPARDGQARDGQARAPRDGGRAGLENKLKAREGGAAGARADRPAGDRQAAPRKPGAKPTALRPDAGGGTAAKKAKNRGAASAGTRRDAAGSQRPAKAKAAPQRSSVAKKNVQRKPAAKQTAMKKDRGGAKGAGASKKRAGGGGKKR